MPRTHLEIVKKADTSGKLQLFLVFYVTIVFEKTDDDFGRYTFVAEWYDPEASLLRKFYLFFFTGDNTLELYDIKNRRTFLKRTKCEGIADRDMYVGNTVNVFSRLMSLVEYGDAYTKNKLMSKTERTFAMVKPDAIHKFGPILEIIINNGFKVSKAKMAKFTRDQVGIFYKEHLDKHFFPTLREYIISGPVVALELIGENAIDKWRKLLGPTDSRKAATEAPGSIRAQFGKDTTLNAAHGSDSPASAQRELNFFFPSNPTDLQSVPATTATFDKCTCCVIKPHAIQEGLLGRIVTKIQEHKYNITAFQMFYLDYVNAEEFLEVYRGVVPEYSSMVSQFSSGPCVAMEITSEQKEETPVKFRVLTGPADPEIAQQLRPQSLRAIFGKDKIRNAVHCTDLPDDGILEVEYFFKLLADSVVSQR